VTWAGGLAPSVASQAPRSEPVPRGRDAFERARAYVAKMDGAVTGQGGHDATWRVARKCAADFGLSEAETLDVLREFNVRCVPPWSDGELAHKARDAATKSRVSNPVGDRERHWAMPTEHYAPSNAAANENGVPPIPDGRFDDDIGAGLEPETEPTDEQAPKRTEQRCLTPGDVLDSWASEGPLIHEATGIARLDELTGGGPVYGSRWYLAGAPDAGKTALLLQLAHALAHRGVTVGLLAVDEEPSDIVTRLAQRLGYERIDCEVRDPSTLDVIRSELAALPLRIYNDDWTIEAAAADLASYARERAAADPPSHPNGPRAMLGVDSLQTVACATERATLLSGARELSEVGAVTARVRAIRAVSSAHRMFVLATSELGRSSYRSSDPSQQTATMAGAKWSGAVEYSARVLLGLRSVPDQPDMVDLEVAKNKHGPRDEHVFLRIDRRSQTLVPVDYEPKPAPAQQDRDDAARDRVVKDAAAVARVLAVRPGIGLRELRGATRAAAGIGHDRVEAGLALLDDYELVRRGTGPRGAKPLTLEPGNLADAPEAVRKAIEEAKC